MKVRERKWMRVRLRRENCRAPRWLEQGEKLDDRRLVVHWWISSMSNGSESLDQNSCLILSRNNSHVFSWPKALYSCAWIKLHNLASVSQSIIVTSLSLLASHRRLFSATPSTIHSHLDRGSWLFSIAEKVVFLYRCIGSKRFQLTSPHDFVKKRTFV